MDKLEQLCDSFMSALCLQYPDPSHDILHVRRVVKIAKKLAEAESADLEVVVPAAYLHDCVYVSKTDERRSKASQLSAEKAYHLLKSWGYVDETFLTKVQHAIAAHSFSAQIDARSKEAEVVQDADRLDAIGAIGIARCFAFSGLANRSLHAEIDPFAQSRILNDQTNTLDHFYIKLLRLSEKLNTQAARAEGKKRMDTMNLFLDSLKAEI